jgi:hypothetical protein
MTFGCIKCNEDDELEQRTLDGEKACCDKQKLARIGEGGRWVVLFAIGLVSFIEGRRGKGGVSGDRAKGAPIALRPSPPRPIRVKLTLMGL